MSAIYEEEEDDGLKNRKVAARFVSSSHFPGPDESLSVVHQKNQYLKNDRESGECDPVYVQNNGSDHACYTERCHQPEHCPRRKPAFSLGPLRALLALGAPSQFCIQVYFCHSNIALVTFPRAEYMNLTDICEHLRKVCVRHGPGVE